MKLPTPVYPIGATVYPKLDPCTDNALLVTGYTVRSGGWLVYLVTDAEGDETARYDYELTSEVVWSTTPNDGGEA